MTLFPKFIHENLVHLNIFSIANVTLISKMKKIN